MSLLKDRLRFSNKGLGNLEVREVSPTSDAAYQNLGFLSETVLSDVSEMEDIADETGSMQNTLERTRAARMKTNLMQVSIDEMNYINNSANKYHSIRYSGLMNEGIFQFFSFEQGRIIRNLARQFTNQKQTIPFEFLALKQEPTTFTTPEYHMAEAKGRIRTEHLQLWINPRWLGTPERLSDRVFDISGFARHGSLNSDYASIWTTGTPESLLAFDGVNDILSFGDILDDDGSSDLMVELWVKILGADGTTQRLMSKKESTTATSKGFQIYRHTNNEVVFGIADGTTSVINNMPSTLLQNTWCHVAFTMDRNGNLVGYKNGVAGSGVSVAAVGSGANAIPLKIASLDTAFANIQTGGMRIYNFGAGGLPSNIATIVANHYSAEKSYYGL